MATYYWVGGTGTWNSTNTTNWSASSGGAGGSGPPNSTDTVIFDVSSGTGTCTTAAGSACAIATLNSSTLGLTLGANHTMSGTFTLTLGSLNLNGNTLTCSAFLSANTNTRSIAFGVGKIVLTGNNSVIINISSNTGFSLTGTPVMECTYAGAVGTRTIGFGQTVALTEANTINLRILAGGDIITLAAVSSVNDLFFDNAFTGSLSNNQTNIYGNFTASTGMTFTAGGSALQFISTSSKTITTNGKTLDCPVSFNGINGSWRLTDNLTLGTTRNATLTNGTLNLDGKVLTCATFQSNNNNVRSVLFGTGNITLVGNGTNIIAAPNASNLTFTGTPVFNCTYSGSTGTRTLVLATANAFANPSSAPTINVTAGGDIFTWQNANVFNDFIISDTFTGSMTPTNAVIYGGIRFSVNMTVTSATSAVLTFAATSGPKNITFNGKTLNSNVVFNGVGGIWACQDAFTLNTARSLTFTNGTIQLKNGVTSTVGSFVANNSSVKFLQSTTPGSQATLSQPSGTVNVVDLTIRDINAVGGASWNAYTDFENTDAGNNDGWDFGLSPPYSIAELPITLRPFTQPRRF